MENITASNSSYGIYLQNSFNSNVSNCSCSGNWVGICLQGSYNSSVEDNIATDNEKGISLYEADNNTLTGNTLDNNYYGIRLFSSNRNLIFHNNLVKNTEQADLINSHQNHWNNEIEGNFWGEHNGTDAGDNGICADQYVIDAENSDTYPLMGRFQNFVVYYDEQLLRVSVISNSTIYDFAYSNSTITFIVNGPYQNLGFCRICIPHDLVGPEIGVIIDGGTTEMLHVNYTVYDDGLHRWVYFTYRHSEHEILIVPESFQSLMLCLLVFTASAYIAKLKKPLVIANIKATLNIFQNMHRDTHSRKV
jgi:parallel beta-helix repeat protein